jgi:hypothetical protein
MSQRRAHLNSFSTKDVREDRASLMSSRFLAGADILVTILVTIVSTLLATTFKDLVEALHCRA